MITLNELLSGNNFDSLPIEHQNNLAILFTKINKIRTAWNKPLIVTSGYRSREHHKEIYIKKGIAENKIPWGSNHLIGAAVDILD